MTHGAIKASWVNPAISVCVAQLPTGAPIFSRWPQTIGLVGGLGWSSQPFRPLPDRRLHSNLPRRNKHNTFRLTPNSWQPMDKLVGTLTPYIGAAALGRNQRLFLYVNPSRDSRSAIDEWWICTPSASASASRSSKSEMSGSCMISSSKNARWGANLPLPGGRP